MLMPTTNPSDGTGMGEDLQERGARGSRNEETRQRNLSLMLGSVHHAKSLSRADLTHRSGLNRSTVGALVAELTDLGLVVEVEPAHVKRAGRPSPVVQPSPHVVALAVNPDVAGVTLGLVRLGGHVVARETVLTPDLASPTDAALLARDFLARTAEDLDPQTRIAGVGVAVPGLVDERDHSVRLAPNLGWSDVAIAEVFEEELALPTSAANDASVGVVAESLFGAGSGIRNVMYLNGSVSGLGGGVICDGSLVRGAHGFATELGHMLLTRGGDACACGRAGCLETEVNVQRIWRALGTDFVGLDDLDYVYANEPSEALAEELDRQADALASGIASLVCIFGSERVILGGHVGALLEARGPQIRNEVRRQAYGPLGRDVSIVRNQLRERMVSIGAAELAFKALLEDPANTPLYALDLDAQRAHR